MVIKTSEVFLCKTDTFTDSWRWYKKFTEDYPNYEIYVLLCAFSAGEMAAANTEFAKEYPRRTTMLDELRGFL